jgi:hypothetical protein
MASFGYEYFQGPEVVIGRTLLTKNYGAARLKSKLLHFFVHVVYAPEPDLYKRSAAATFALPALFIDDPD